LLEVISARSARRRDRRLLIGLRQVDEAICTLAVLAKPDQL
jgi:hypothetical protein